MDLSISGPVPFRARWDSRKKLLNDGEDVILDLSPHWSTLAKPVAVLVVALAATIAGYVVQPPVGYVFAVVLLWSPAGWRCGSPGGRTPTSWSPPTGSSTARGSIAKHGKEIPLERVNDIRSNRACSSA